MLDKPPKYITDTIDNISCSQEESVTAADFNVTGRLFVNITIVSIGTYL